MLSVPGKVLVCELERYGRDINACDGDVGDVRCEQRVEQQRDAAGAVAEVQDAEVLERRSLRVSDESFGEERSVGFCLGPVADQRLLVDGRERDDQIPRDENARSTENI